MVYKGYTCARVHGLEFTVYGKMIQKQEARKKDLVPYTLHLIPHSYGLEKMGLTEVLGLNKYHSIGADSQVTPSGNFMSLTSLSRPATFFQSFPDTFSVKCDCMRL